MSTKKKSTSKKVSRSKTPSKKPAKTITESVAASPSAEDKYPFTKDFVRAAETSSAVNTFVDVCFSKEELANAINFLNVTAKMYESLAMSAADQGDNGKFTMLSARFQLTVNFATRLQQALQIGQPESGILH